ncbi:hypothetical protein E2542_SST17057 [Spatholobus suberectus]|nr:hypothetical protein E2542_SST17057 [Spatholobus suberectus]
MIDQRRFPLAQYSRRMGMSARESKRGGGRCGSGLRAAAKGVRSVKSGVTEKSDLQDCGFCEMGLSPAVAALIDRDLGWNKAA